MDLRSELLLVIERLVRRILGRMVGRVAYGVLLVALIPVVAVLGIVIFAVVAIVLFGLYALIGEPKALAPVVGSSWIVGSLVVLFLVLLRGHRWLARLEALADRPARMIDPDGDEPIVAPIEPGPSPISSTTSTFQKRLAAADARHALSEAPAETPGRDRAE